ncbi:hypothetical protein J8J40_33925, partial [Mycobacterium tuberculosis]|nr:hypothetical protein [Mycobacterium tuberculosis]
AEGSGGPGAAGQGRRGLSAAHPVRFDFRCGAPTGAVAVSAAPARARMPRRLVILLSSHRSEADMGRS